MSTFFYMLLAFVVGVLVGWFIWGRLRGELDSLRGDLDRTRSERDRLRADCDRLKGELDACGRARADLESRLRDAPSAKDGADKAATPAPAAMMSTPTTATSAKAAKPASARKPAATKTAVAPKPAAKTAAPKKAAGPAAKKAAAPTTGKADNLRRLIGVGPVNERLLKGLGVTTYAQIAAWTDADVKRVEEVLNFDGRIAREKWIEQAKLLAAGNEAEFARQFPSAGTASNS
ncbi:proton-conducting membrane transporter [Mesorhizobium sp. WSM4935]|uniref:proton-conducting membrane transporter n=1 Tax=Mesorhizobium sp. WSM4935 TaxID=3038547 RepID=UPI002414E1A9|nr:proton-conducting membrane transporter [Mesorhizobium sp. WSM4935]MDG4875880.1 proton-conducting membrane transporter [Mesorhizobium sp. WSM4935]